MNPIPVSDPPPAPSRKPGPFRSIIIALGCAALPAVGLLAWYVAARVQDSSVARRFEREAAQRGEPLTLAELAASLPPVHDSSNAATALIRLWKQDDPDLWNAFLEGLSHLPEKKPRHSEAALLDWGKAVREADRGKPISPASRQAAEVLLNQRKEHFDSLERAVQLPNCRWPLRYKDGYLTLMPHLPALKDEAGILRTRALLAIDRGEVSNSLHCIETIVRLSQSLETEPFLISQLVRLGIIQMATELLEHLLSRMEPSMETLTRLDQLVLKVGVANGLKRSLLGERAQALHLFQVSNGAFAEADAANEGVDPARIQVLFRLWDLAGCFAPDRRLMMETMSKALELASEDSPEAYQEILALEVSVERKVKQPPPRLISNSTLPALSRAFGRFGDAEGRRRALRVGLAVEKYRLAHRGELPEKLTELAPRILLEVPLDPFDGKPLRYRKLDKGYVVYSIGHDLQDDGGIGPLDKGGKAKNSDVTFTVAR